MILHNLKRSLLAIFVFILPLLLFVNNTSPVYTKVIFAVVVTVILAGIWLLDAFRHKPFSIRFSQLSLPATGLLLIMGISTYNTLNMALSMEALITIVIFFILFLFVVNHTHTKSDLYLVVGSIVLSISIAAGYGLLQYFGALPGHPNPRIPGEAILSSVGNKNFLGELLVFLVYPTFMLFLVIRGTPFKLLCLACQSIMIVTLILIDSDATWLVLAGATVIWIVCIAVWRPTRPFARNKGWILSWLITVGIFTWLATSFVPWILAFGFPQALYAREETVFLAEWPNTGIAQVGVYQRSTGTLLIADENLPAWRAPPSLKGGYPVVGDWDLNGKTDIGLYQDGNFYWDLDFDSNMDVQLQLHAPEGYPLVGDWDGDGLLEHGVYGVHSRTFWFEASDEVVSASSSAEDGLQTIPIVGDWNGDGRDSVGLYWSDSGKLKLDKDGIGTLTLQVLIEDAAPQEFPVVRQTTSIVGLYSPTAKTIRWDDNLDGVIDRIESLNDKPFSETILNQLKPSLVIRLQDWSLALMMLSDFPAVGSGISNYSLRFLPYKRQLMTTPFGQQLESIEAHSDVGYIPRAIYAHNDYLQIGAELGSFGLILFGILLFVMFRHAFAVLHLKEQLSQATRFVFLTLIVTLVAIMIDALVGFPLHVPSSAMIAVVFLGVLFSPLFGSRGPVLKLSGMKKSAFAIAGLVFGALFLAISAYDFQADVVAQEGITFYNNELTQLGARKLEESIKLDLVPKEAVQYLGDFYAPHAERSTELASKCVYFNRQALQVMPTEQGYLDLASCYVALDELDLALDALESVAGMDAELWVQKDMLDIMDRLYHLILAQREEREGDPSRASLSNLDVQRLDMLSRVASLSPRSWSQHSQLEYQRAMILAQSKEDGKELAINYLGSLLGSHLDQAIIHFGLGQLMDGEQAILELETALAIATRQRLITLQNRLPSEEWSREAMRLDSLISQIKSFIESQ